MSTMLKGLLFFFLALTEIWAFKISRLESVKKIDPKVQPTWKDIKDTRVAIRNEFRKLKRYNPKYVAQLEKANNNKLLETPYFSLFMRPKLSGEWLPISEFTGDQRSRQIVKSWLSSDRDMLKNFFKRQIDRSVSASFFPQKNQIIQSVIEKYEPFKEKSPEDFEFGYKIAYFDAEVNTGEQEMTVITEEMTKGWVDEIKDSVTKLFEPKEDEPEDTSLGATFQLPIGKTEKESCLEIYGEDSCLSYKEKNGVFPWQEKGVTESLQNFIQLNQEMEEAVKAGKDPFEEKSDAEPVNEPWRRRNMKTKFNGASKLRKAELMRKNLQRNGNSAIVATR